MTTADHLRNMDLKKDLIQLLDRLDAARVMNDVAAWVDEVIIAQAEEAAVRYLGLEPSIPGIQADKDCSTPPPNGLTDVGPRIQVNYAVTAPLQSFENTCTSQIHGGVGK